MTKKQFKIIKLIIVALLATTISISVNLNLAFIPPIAILASAFLIRFLYAKVNEITADERDYKLGGQSAMLSYSIVSISLTILGSSLLAYSTTDPTYYRPGYLLLYIVCFMVITNIITFLYYQKKEN